MSQNVEENENDNEREEEELEINMGRSVINIIKEHVSNNKRFFSFEFYPPKSDTGVTSLKKRLFKMSSWGSQWMDVTWGAGGTTSDLTPNICSHIQNNVKNNCMMHLTCTNMPREKVDEALNKAKSMGLKNILALRGDPPVGQKEWKAIDTGFSCALDLVKYIKQKYGDYFGITVSGYPEGHPIVRKTIVDTEWNPETNTPKYYAVKKIVKQQNIKSDDNNDDKSPTETETIIEYEGVSAKDWDNELNYLKQKCESGAGCIITQLFYDADVFIDFVKDCRNYGITAPIMPGIMPIRNYGLFFRMTGFCKTVIPQNLRDGLEKYKNDGDELYKFGLNYVSSMAMKVMSAKDNNGKYLVPGMHLYTMNLERAALHVLNKCKEMFNFENEDYLEQETIRVNNNYEQKLLEDEAKKVAEQQKQNQTQSFKPVTSF